MTANQILIGVGLIVVLAVGAQVLASRLRIPAIIVLLPAGFIRQPFFETLVQLIIGILFISISATVTPQSLRHLVLPTLVLTAVLGQVPVTKPTDELGGP
ncbi:MAG: hypothetical protein ACLP5E_08520 [Streptosporangiaceae bacterium]